MVKAANKATRALQEFGVAVMCKGAQLGYTGLTSTRLLRWVEWCILVDSKGLDKF